MKTEPKPGDIIVIKINGEEFTTTEIATHEYAGIRQHLGEIATIVNNELPESNEKIGLISEKLLRVGDGYDISTSKFEQFRRSLAAVQNYVGHEMID